jgi:hypothetical protein
LLAGFGNPAMFIFEGPLTLKGEFKVKYRLPFDATKLTAAERLREFDENSPLEFSHSLEDQIGGQLDAGFFITGLYEDRQDSPLGKYIPAYIATRAVKPMG